MIILQIHEPTIGMSNPNHNMSNIFEVIPLVTIIWPPSFNGSKHIDYSLILKIVAQGTTIACFTHLHAQLNKEAHKMENIYSGTLKHLMHV